MRHKLAAIAGAVVLAAVAGCGAMPSSHTRDAQAQPSVDRNSTEATVIAGYLDVCLRVARGTPAEQAEILTTATNDYRAAPTPSRVLRYAMVLSTPGHAGNDPVVAQRLLREVLASPETLLPAERALAFVQMQQVERELALLSDNRRLQANAERTANEKIATLTRQVKTESDEKARLERLLKEAQAKLDAIANIERSSTNGRPQQQPEGRKP